jgi:hypothetical protein
VDATQAQDLAFDSENPIARLILDPEVATEREKRLVQHVGMPRERHRRIS